MRRCAIAAALVLLLASCGHLSTHDIAVHFYIDTKFGGDILQKDPVGLPCTSKVASGSARIIVKDGSGKILATQLLSLPSGGTLSNGGSVTGYDCDMGQFALAAVPASDFYEFSLEGVAGSVHESAAELRTAGWRVSLVADP